MIFLGKILKTRGNKGEVVVQPSPKFDLYPFSEREVLNLKSSKYTLEKKIEYCKELQGKIVFKFVDINSINDAYKLISYSIYGLNALDNDLQMLEVVNFKVKDLSNNSWGIVSDFINSNFNNLLEVKNENDEIIFIPYADSIIKEINENEMEIIIDPPEGLKDLNK